MNIKTYRVERFEIHSIVEDFDSITGLKSKRYFLQDSTLIKVEFYNKQKLEQVYNYRKNGSLKFYEKREYIMEPNFPKTKFDYYPYTKERTTTDYYAKNGKPLFRKIDPEQPIKIKGLNQFVTIFRNYNSKGHLVPIWDTVIHEIVAQ